jgi:hypothetical protein
MKTATARRLSPTPHTLSGGSAPPARRRSVCSLRPEGASGRHRTLTAAPDALRKAAAPSRAGLLGAVACFLPWAWHAALCTPAGLPCGLGQALARQARHGAWPPMTSAPLTSAGIRLQGGQAPSGAATAYAAKSFTDTSNNTVRCTAGGKEAIQLAIQVVTSGARAPCSCMKASR